jgi:hypothetical protein
MSLHENLQINSSGYSFPQFMMLMKKSTSLLHFPQKVIQPPRPQNISHVEGGVEYRNQVSSSGGVPHFGQSYAK